MCWEIKLMTLNMALLTDPTKRQRLAMLIIKEQINVICFQETHLCDAEMKYLKDVFCGSIYQASSRTRSKGVMI